MKVGDKLYCHKCCIMDFNDERTTTIGVFYTIVEINLDDKEFVIIDDNGDEHFFTMDDYDKWFYNIRELRRNK